MSKESAGIIMYRLKNGFAEVLLIHPGGPFWMNKDNGAWSIPKGELDDGEDHLTAAIREFEEETGTKPDGKFIPLKQVKLKSGKIIHPFAVNGDLDETGLKSNSFLLEWPVKSGNMKEFPEVDRAGWFDLDSAREKVNFAQKSIIDELEGLLIR